MARRPFLALLVVTSVVAAGCSGAPGGSSPAPTTPPAPTTAGQPSPSPTPTATSTSSPTSPETTTTARSGAPTANDTVDYTALSSTQKRAFDRALDGTVQFVDDSALESPYVGDEYVDRDAADPFRTHDYVRKNDTYYRVSYEESGGYGLATYGIRATEGEPPDDASVVALKDLSTEVRNPVEWAIENGSYGVPAGKWSSLPQEFDRFEYVRAPNGTYRITVVYGDLFADTLHVERVEVETLTATEHSRDARN
ncbi:hypothetical protein [Salinigranum sp.]|uniref:hypothetical protein n=1 Tax=Salinigranum sp. TaxID=1966351 RepID=UPI003564CA54